MPTSKKEVILVTGGCGFIGKAVIKALTEKYDIIAADKACALPPATNESVFMDISSPESVDAALERIKYAYGNKIASVIHLAAYYDFSGEPSPLYDEITIEGTRNLLRSLQKFEVEQFIFSSSLLVYAPVEPGEKITEKSRVEPKWDYPESKIKAEEVIHRERKNIPSVVLRVAGVYDDMTNSIPIAHHIQRIYENKVESHFFPGDVTHGNPFVHLDDLVDAIVKSVERRKELPPEVVINIGETETLSYEDLQNKLGNLIHGHEWKTYHIPKPSAKAGAWVQDVVGDPFIKPWMIDMADDHMELDISKAKQLIGWQPKHTLSKTLPKMIEALKADPKKWYRQNKLSAD